MGEGDGVPGRGSDTARCQHGYVIFSTGEFTTFVEVGPGLYKRSIEGEECLTCMPKKPVFKDAPPADFKADLVGIHCSCKMCEAQREANAQRDKKAAAEATEVRDRLYAERERVLKLPHTSVEHWEKPLSAAVLEPTGAGVKEVFVAPRPTDPTVARLKNVQWTKDRQSLVALEDRIEKDWDDVTPEMVSAGLRPTPGGPIMMFFDQATASWHSTKELDEKQAKALNLLAAQLREGTEVDIGEIEPALFTGEHRVRVDPVEVMVNDPRAYTGEAPYEHHGMASRAEVPVVNTVTGGIKNQKPERYSLIPADAMAEVARVYGYGSGKYAPRNWEKGYAWSLSMDALERHIADFKTLSDLDLSSPGRPGSGLHHMAHVVFHALALIRYTQEFPELDDVTTRPRPVRRKEE